MGVSGTRKIKSLGVFVDSDGEAGRDISMVGVSQGERVSYVILSALQHTQD